MAAAGGPIRVAFCITDLDPGGAERALVQLVTRLDRKRWLPALYCLSAPGPLVEPLQAAGIPVACLGARHAGHLGVILRLRRELCRFQPELLQTFLFHANFAGRIAGRLAGVPHLVAGIRVAEKRGRMHLWLDRLTNGLVERNVCVSQAVADFSMRVAGLRPEKVVVIPNGVDLSAFADVPPADLTPFEIPPGSRVLIAVGRLDPQKGLEFLLDAMPQIVSQDHRVHLLLVGTGPLRPAIERWIGGKGLAGNVHLAGWRADVPSLLRASHALVLASLWEGMPNAVLEAMAAGLPVVATCVEGTTELVRDRETGRLVAPGSAGELALAITEILQNPGRAAAMGQAGQNRVRAEFSWEKAVARYDALYASLLKIG